MAIERKTLEDAFHRLGSALSTPATLCAIGSAPAILFGQPSRQTLCVDALPSDFLPKRSARRQIDCGHAFPVVLSAAKLVRASENDVKDIVWWVRHRAIEMKQLEQAIDRLLSQRHRETARENLVFVRLVSGP